MENSNFPLEFSPPSDVQHIATICKRKCCHSSKKIELYGHFTKADQITMAYEHFWRLSMCQVCYFCHLSHSYAVHPDL